MSWDWMIQHSEECTKWWIQVQMSLLAEDFGALWLRFLEYTKWWIQVQMSLLAGDVGALWFGFFRESWTAELSEIQSNVDICGEVFVSSPFCSFLSMLDSVQWHQEFEGKLIAESKLLISIWVSGQDQGLILWGLRERQFWGWKLSGKNLAQGWISPLKCLLMMSTLGKPVCFLVLWKEWHTALTGMVSLAAESGTCGGWMERVFLGSMLSCQGQARSWRPLPSTSLMCFALPWSCRTF